ncbi:MAG: DNA mismatch repair endonuclease MutL [Acidithiobacillus sp.]|uniref:DNA mismatch repair endonuclease MutL n=1 Tax=Acidithiobacillus sp. TaxID=1872118 RepID=UPI003D03ECDF
MTRNPIRILDATVADQIAAGEVVERPASVLKELLENSLDAGAQHLRIRLEDGGMSLLAVEDDGIGIPAEELPLALQRHATSKLRRAEDLLRIQSFGFRGEALPAIASVARLRIQSRPAEAAAALQIEVEGGRLGTPRYGPRAPGTTVEVRDLFFNVPARRKFLRSAATELGRIQRVLRQTALVHFAVGFELLQGSRVLAHFAPAAEEPAQDARVGEILGLDFLANSLRFTQEDGELQVWGWLGLPTHSRARADEQHFFVNGRPVRDSGLSHALRAAYADVLYQDRHPVAVLHLTMPPHWVDVNVHPAKTELRFADSRRIHDFLRHAIREVIAHETRPSRPLARTASAPNAVAGDRGRGAHAGAGPVRGISPTPSRSPIQPPATMVAEPGAHYWEQVVAPVYRAQEDAVDVTAASAIQEKLGADAPPLGYAIGQVHQRFVVAVNAQGLILVDQHAAHERILYERLKARRTGERSQTLLLPQVLSLTAADFARLDERTELLTAAGFRWTVTGPQHIHIQAGPADIPSAQYPALFQDYLTTSFAQLGDSDAFLAERACKAAIKTNHELSLAQMNALLRELEACPRYSQCNHGRPTVVELRLAELDRLFLRGR